MQMTRAARAAPGSQAPVRALACAVLCLCAPLAIGGDLAGPEFGAGSVQLATISQAGQLNMASLDQYGPGVSRAAMATGS